MGTLVGISLLVMVASPCRTEEKISREAPSAWELFRNRLVPLEKALSYPEVPRSPTQTESEPEIETILKHDYVKIAADGSSLLVSHRVEKLLEESGREKFSTQRIEFRPSHNKLHVVTARTFTPEGKFVEVSDEGIFLEQPQNGNDSLFTDVRAIRIVFPDTRPGSVIEWITVEETAPLIPGNWSGGVLWGDIWPVRDIRYVAEFPASLAERVVWEGIGVYLEPKRENTDDGGSRWTWAAKQLAAPVLQVNMPSLRQRGPRLRVGSGEDWDRFGSWFSGLVSEVSGQSDEVDLAAEKWAAGVEDPRKTAAILFDRVSQDIRYTGLEFGEGAFQPRSPETVLKSRYGDCKDKSNLLRILLKNHGIPSRLGLLHSDLPGEISREIASTSLFNHVILAVDLPGETSPVFCDPTIDGVPFGIVSERDEGKDVLLIDDTGELEWLKIPRAGISKLRMNADISIEPTGAYSGWFDVRVSGAQGWWLRRRFETTSSRSKRIDLAGEWFFRFVAGRKIIDGESLGSSEEFPFNHRFYLFQDPATVQASEKTVRIQIPILNQIVTQLGPAGLRIHPYVATPVDCDVEVSFTLPESIELLDQVKDYAASSEGIDISTLSSRENNRLVARVVMRRSLSEFSPRQFSGLSESVRGLVTHLGTPVLFLRKEGMAGDNWAPDPNVLPKMPSSEGFAQLINCRFPFLPQKPWDADHDARLVAFNRMAEIYPQEDHEGQFTAALMSRTSRLFLGSEAEECRKVAEETRELIRRYEGKLEPEKFMAAELIAAAALLEAGEREATLEICERILSKKSGFDMIRQAAAAMVAPLISETDAIRSADLAKLALQNDLLPDVEWLALASIYLDAIARIPPLRDTTDLLAAMEWVKAARPDLDEDLTDGFLKGPFQLVSYGHHEAALRFKECLSENSVLLDLDDSDLDELSEYFEAVRKAEPLHSRLKAYLAENPWPDLEVIEEGDFIENAVDCLDIYREDVSIELRYILRGLSQYGPQHDFMDRLSEFFTSSERWYNEPGKKGSDKTISAPDLEALLDLLVELWKESPEGDEATLADLSIVEGELLERRRGHSTSEAYFFSLANDGAVDDIIRLRAIQKVADSRSSGNDVEGYLKALEMFEPFKDFREWRDGSLANGAYVALAHGDRDEAWRRFRLIASDEVTEEASYPDQVRKASIAWTAESVLAEKWWNQSEGWWPVWEKLAQRLRLSLPSSDNWSEYEPWNGLSKKRINQLTAAENGKNSKTQLRQALVKQMEFTRWHREGTPGATLLLERGAELFSKEAETFLHLARRLSHFP